MTAFTPGQRVRTTVNAPAAWPGAYGAPAGTLGTIAGLDSTGTAYDVVLDGDPDALPASYDSDEIAPA